MPDWFETLQDIGGAFTGITQGLTQGMKPFEAWEGVRTKDLANDRSDILLRDLMAQQAAREGDDYFGYYTDQAGAQRSGFQKTRAGNERDLYGIEQGLAQRQALDDPDGEFQTLMRQMGVTPEDPNYRRFLSQYMAQYDPMGAVAAYDKMGVPAIEQRNMTQAAVMSFLESKLPPGAQIIANNDGSFTAVGSDGVEVQIPWRQALAAASMSGKPTDPMSVISNIIKDQTLIQKGNTEAWRAVNPDDSKERTQQRLAANSLMTAAQRDFDAAQREIAAIQKYAKENFLEEAQVAELLTPVRQRAEEAQRRGREAAQLLQQVTGVTMAGGPAASRFGRSGSSGAPVPQGGTSVTTRPAPGAGASRAAGGAGGGAPGGAPGYGRGSGGAAVSPRPPGRMYDTGNRPITQGEPGVADLQAIMQMFGIQ